MNFTNLMISFLIAISIVSGLNIYAGSVLLAYNTTTDIGLNNYSCTGNVCTQNPYISWVTTTAANLTSITQQTPGASLGVLIITGIFWVMAAVGVLLNTVSGIGYMAQGLMNTAAGSNLFVIPSFVMGMISLIIMISVVGYILFLILGKGGDNSASV
jgi:hypothetical protein